MAATKKRKSPAKPLAEIATNRRAVVFVSLAGVLSATTGLLIALSPGPLTGRGETLLNHQRTATAASAAAPVAVPPVRSPGR